MASRLPNSFANRGDSHVLTVEIGRKFSTHVFQVTDPHEGMRIEPFQAARHIEEVEQLFIACVIWSLDEEYILELTCRTALWAEPHYFLHTYMHIWH